ncbi:hypothetical protein [Promicromonospora sukumoe]
MTDRIVRSLLTTTRASAPPRTDGYDAFLSYSRDSDGEFAPAFHAQLLDFDKREDVPDLNIFLDRTGLANNPSLWDAIERKLERSDYLILFASEGAASSKYVAKEVAWWLDHRGPGTLLVALTSGKIVWDQTANEIDAISTTALPAPLVERIDHEPKWTDLTPLRQRRFWRHHPYRPGVLAELVAPLRGPDVSTEEILSAHIARQSSAGLRNRLVNMALGVMLALSIGAFAFAEREADRANEAVNANAAHLLGATSHVVQQDDPATAQLLAVEAVERLRDGQTRTALFNAVTANEPADPYLLRTVDVPEETGLADVAPTATGVVGRTETGDLVRWNPDDGAPTVLRGDRTPFGSVGGAGSGHRSGPGRTGPVVSGSADGAVVAAVDDLGVTVGRFGPLPEGGTSRQTHLDLPGTTAVAVTPDGDTLLIAWRDAESGRNRIGSINLAGRDLAVLESDDGAQRAPEQRLAFRSKAETDLEVTSLAVGSSRTVAVADTAAGTLEIRSLDSLEPTGTGPVDLPEGAVPSPSLRDWATLASDGDTTTVTLHHWADGSVRTADCPVPRTWSDPEVVAVDDATTRALVATDNGLVACEIGAGTDVHRTWHLSGIRRPGSPVLVGVDRVAAASDGRIALWSTADTHGDVPLPGAAGVAATGSPGGPTAVLATFRAEPTLPAGTAVSWSDGTVMIHGLGTVHLPAGSPDAGRPLLPVWLDADRLLLVTPDGDAYRTQGGTAAGYEAGFRDLVARGLDQGDPDCATIVSAQRTRDDVVLVDACSGLHVLDAGLQEQALYVPGPLGTTPRLAPEWAEPGRVAVADDGSELAVAPRDFSLRVADLDAAARGETDVWTVRGSSVDQVRLIGARSSAEETAQPERLVTLGLDSKVRLRAVTGPGDPEGLDLTGTYGDVLAVLPGPDLVARNQGEALAFFDIETGQKVGALATRLYAPGGRVRANDVYAGDGQLLVVQDHGVTTGWTFSDDQMIARACAMAGRTPTAEDMPDGVTLSDTPACTD